MIPAIVRECVRATGRLTASAALVVALAFGGGCSSGRGFATPEEGAQALVAALDPFNEQELRAILGPEGNDIIASGDEVADRQAAESFVADYGRRHKVVVQNGTATLLIGEDDWPMPIPLVQEGGTWRFDTAAGKEEVLARRIGRNELSAIESVRAVADAQREYSAMHAQPGQALYAQKFASDPATRNGLYWETKEGEPPSPLGPLVAEAVTEGYGGRGERAPDEGPRPFHGYLFRMLTAQGPAAPGGAKSYLAEGRMTGGFAVVAWPVEYGNSGIMTFIMRQDGIVYQRDLGEDTDSAARSMTQFDPGEGWEIVP